MLPIGGDTAAGIPYPTRIQVRAPGSQSTPKEREEKNKEGKPGKEMDTAYDAFTLVNRSLHAKRGSRIIPLKRRVNYLSAMSRPGTNDLDV